MRFDPAMHRSLQTTFAAPPRRQGAWAQLLTALIELTGGKGELLRHAERAWASATFSGSRHTVALAFCGEDAVAVGEAFIEALPDHEFTLPGRIVADANVVSAGLAALPELKLAVEVELLLLDE